MKKIILTNEVHHTRTEVVLLSNGHVSSKSIDQAARRLCGMKDCACQSVKLNGLQVVDVDGKLYDID